MKNQKNPIMVVFAAYDDLYKRKFGVRPKINGSVCGARVRSLVKDHSVEGICRIVELYFLDPANERQSYHLRGILSNWSFNKYLPKMKYNPDIYENAEELNKKLR